MGNPIVLLLVEGACLVRLRLAEGGQVIYGG